MDMNLGMGMSQETIDREARLKAALANGQSMQFTDGGTNPGNPGYNELAGRLTEAPAQNAFTDSLGWNQPTQQQPANSPNSLGPVAYNGQQNAAPAVPYAQPQSPMTNAMNQFQSQSNPYQAPQQPAQTAQSTAQPTQQYQPNPYLNQMAQGITSQMNDNWTRSQLPSIRSGAMATGGFGGSRQGVVEANGLNDMNRSLGQNLTNLYGTDYTNSMNRNLQQQSISNGYDLGLRSNDLGYANLDASISNSNFDNQLASANFGMNAYNTAIANDRTGITAGNDIQNTPLDYQKYFSDSAIRAGGGGSTTSQNLQGDRLTSGIGLATAAASLYDSYMNPKPRV